MATLQFDLVSPERRLASLEATEVRVPGADGDMTAMADHAPTITTLRPRHSFRSPIPAGTDEYPRDRRLRRHLQGLASPFLPSVRCPRARSRRM